MPVDPSEAAQTAAIVASVAAALKTDTVGKAYDDLRPIVQELGEIGESVLQVVGAPLKLAASHAERIVWLVRAANGQVPDERRRQPAPSLTGAILENIKYLEGENPLLKLYEQLLVAAIDDARVADAHPAFPSLINQLSPDEAVFLYHIARHGVRMIERHRIYDLGTDQETRTHHTVEATVPAGLRFAHHISMYRAHLMALNLIGMLPKSSSEPAASDENGKIFTVHTTVSSLSLSEFGQLFARACIPERWPQAEQDPA